MTNKCTGGEHSKMMSKCDQFKLNLYRHGEGEGGDPPLRNGCFMEELIESGVLQAMYAFVASRQAISMAHRGGLGVCFGRLSRCPMLSGIVQCICVTIQFELYDNSTSIRAWLCDRVSFRSIIYEHCELSKRGVYQGPCLFIVAQSLQSSERLTREARRNQIFFCIFLRSHTFHVF